MSQAFGVPEEILIARRGDSLMSVEVQHHGLVLTSERTIEGLLVLVVRSIDGGSLVVLPSASNAIGIGVAG